MLFDGILECVCELTATTHSEEVFLAIHYIQHIQDEILTTAFYSLIFT